MSVWNTNFISEPARADQEQQREHQVIRGRGDVAHAVHQETPRPQPAEPDDHGESGVDAEGLDELDDRPRPGSMK